MRPLAAGVELLGAERPRHGRRRRGGPDRRARAQGVAAGPGGGDLGRRRGRAGPPHPRLWHRPSLTRRCSSASRPTAPTGPGAAWSHDRGARGARLRGRPGATPTAIAAGKPVGRPHIAQAVVEHPANAARLAEAGLSGALGIPGGLPDRGSPRLSPAPAARRRRGDLARSTTAVGWPCGPIRSGMSRRRKASAKRSTDSVPADSTASSAST